MKKIIMLLNILLITAFIHASAIDRFESDVIKTSAGDLKIYFIGHGTLVLTFNGKVIHIDPYSKLADYSKLPDADMIIITHDHPDHLDKTALGSVQIPKTELVVTETVSKSVPGGIIMKNGDIKTVTGIKIEAVPAYNKMHPRGTGNGYILTFGDIRIYIAGDTGNIPEMKTFKDIYAAFIPMNMPYTMTPEMFTDAALMVQPKILYPYHLGETDTSVILEMLKNKNMEIRIRKMK